MEYITPKLSIKMLSFIKQEILENRRVEGRESVCREGVGGSEGRGMKREKGGAKQ